ncbi:MAG: HEAT repeat domain-containing protein [Planctomyces sp.]|nr:HEAT repeat domain-containing protein [Planctomyces sp.]
MGSLPDQAARRAAGGLLAFGASVVGRAIFVQPTIVVVALAGAYGPAVGADEPPRLYEGQTLDDWRERIGRIDFAAPIRPEDVAGLRSIMADRDAPWFSRRQAALTLARMGAPAAAAIPDLIRLLDEPSDDPETSPRLWALKALARFGPLSAEATPRIVEIIRDRSSPLADRLTATEPLAQIGGRHPAAVPALIEVLEDSSPIAEEGDELELRIAAAEGLSLTRAGLAVPALTEACESSSLRLRRAAATALATFGAEAAPALPVLAGLAAYDDAEEVREAATESLGRMGYVAGPMLAALCGEEEAVVRRRAATALGGMGRTAAPWLDAVRGRLADDDAEVRVAAIAAMWDITGRMEGLEGPVLSLLGAEERSVRISASELLIRMGSAAEGLRPQLVELAETGSPEERTASRRVLLVWPEPTPGR